MTMWLVFTFAAFAAVILYALARAGWTYRRWRGPRLVICPETRDYAAVTVDAADAARRSITGKSDIHLAGCHRWPERGRCDEPCLNQLTDSFDGCRLSTYVERFYRDRHCALCRKPFLDVGWTEHLPAALNDDGATVTWDRVAPERIPQFLKTHPPVCWDCHVAATFRRQHSDMVTDRPWQHQ